MIPDQARQILERLLPAGIPWNDVTLHLEPFAQGASANVPHALVPRNVMAVSLKALARALKTVGMAIGREIWISPEFAKFDTASGLALLAHELVHVLQDERDPDFARKYDAEARRTPEDRPWENVYEAEAYATECVVYRQLVAEGYPAGSWKPLAVDMGLC